IRYGHVLEFRRVLFRSQLPGLAAQRLMAEGYGFAGEGDWRTAALLRVMKVISGNKRTSFMEDYTYHLEPGNEMILGSHMLEICQSLAWLQQLLDKFLTYVNLTSFH